MKKIVPESKFRHLQGVTGKDSSYDGVIASETRLESNIIAVNRKFIAVALQSTGGGTFTVLSRGKPGRVERVYRCVGHTSEIVDLSFDRFNPNRIVSGSDDGFYLVWWIPDEGLLSDMDEIQCQLRHSQKRVIQSEWHPSASGILIGVNIDSITIFNVDTAQALASINTSVDNDQISNASLNFDGSMIAASFKDKYVRVYNLDTLEKVSEFPTHVGTKPIKVAWITEAFDNDLLVTTGATRMSEREVSIWRLSDPGSPLFVLSLGNTTASYNVYYDSDTRVLACYGRGECLINFYEIMGNPDPTLYFLTSHKSTEAQRGVAFGNKMSCNFANHEILHAVRILGKSLEEVSFIVPRKSDLFQDDLFPDTPGEIPALTAEEYEQGNRAHPVKVSLKNFLPEPSSASATLRPTSVFMKEVDRSPRASFVTTGTPQPNLSDEISSLKASISALEERVRVLEQGDESE